MAKNEACSTKKLKKKKQKPAKKKLVHALASSDTMETLKESEEINPKETCDVRFKADDEEEGNNMNLSDFKSGGKKKKHKRSKGVKPSDKVSDTCTIAANDSLSSSTLHLLAQRSNGTTKNKSLEKNKYELTSIDFMKKGKPMLDVTRETTEIESCVPPTQIQENLKELTFSNDAEQESKVSKHAKKKKKGKSSLETLKPANDMSNIGDKGDVDESTSDIKSMNTKSEKSKKKKKHKSEMVTSSSVSPLESSILSSDNRKSGKRKLSTLNKTTDSLTLVAGDEDEPLKKKKKKKNGAKVKSKEKTISCEMQICNSSLEETSTKQTKHENGHNWQSSVTSSHAIGSECVEKNNKHTIKQKKKKLATPEANKLNSEKDISEKVLKMSSKSTTLKQNLSKDQDNSSYQSETSKVEGIGQWSNVELGSAARQEKFMRLLGGRKKEHGGNIVDTKRFSSLAMDAMQSKKLANALENQFNASLEFNLQKRAENNKSKGLGFVEDPAKGKKFHIDVGKIKSKKFNY